MITNEFAGNQIKKKKKKKKKKTLEQHELWLKTDGLQGANLDFSVWPLWCGSRDVKIDKKQVIQFFAHAFNVGKEYWPGELTKEQIEFINEFHQKGFEI